MKFTSSITGEQLLFNQVSSSYIHLHVLAQFYYNNLAKRKFHSIKERTTSPDQEPFIKEVPSPLPSPLTPFDQTLDAC